MIEVLVTALVVALLAAGIAQALIAGAQTTADQRHRSQAAELAQADQERLKGLSAAQLNALSTPQTRVVTLDGTPYTISSQATFLNSTGGSACGSTGPGAAAYYEVLSTLSWASSPRGTITVESQINPPAGGTLLTQVQDQAGNPLSGVSVSASGADSASGTTDTNGCTIFSGLSPGDFTLTLTDPGYVDTNDNSLPITTAATVTSSGTATPSSGNPITIGQAGTFNANFTTVETSGGSTVTGQQADAVSWYGSGTTNSMSNYKSQAYGSSGVQGSTIPSTGSIMLYPFAFLGPPVSYANNYQVWAGPCRQAQPPNGIDTFEIDPGSSQTLAVQEPAMAVIVKNSSGTQIAPDNIEIKYASTRGSGTSCTDKWFPAIASDAATNTNGALAYPGVPFANTSSTGSNASASGLKASISICADKSSHFAEVTGLTNTNFNQATTVNITVPSSGFSSSGTCARNSGF